MKKKKNWVEKFEQRLKSRFAKYSEKKFAIITIAAVVLPFIGWAIGASTNPSGWASDISGFVILLFLVSVMYWFISVPLAFIATYLLLKHAFFSASILFFITSLLVSILICIITASVENSFIKFSSVAERTISGIIYIC